MMAKKLILKRLLPLLLILMLCMSMTTVAMAGSRRYYQTFFYCFPNEPYEGAVVTNLTEKSWTGCDFDPYGYDGQGRYYAYMPQEVTDPVCEGYVFKGWLLSPNLYRVVYYYPGDYLGTNSNCINLFAGWTKAYNFAVNYDVNGGDVGSAPTGSEVPNAASPYTFVVKYKEPTREGYVFTGWNTAADGSGTAYAPATA